MAGATESVFRALRALYTPFADVCVVIEDSPRRYYLGSQEVRQKDGYRTGFGGVEIGKRYVAAHLIPIYVHPELLEGVVSPELARRRQGKSCFNFTAVDDRLFAELQGLIRRGAARFAVGGRL